MHPFIHRTMISHNNIRIRPPPPRVPNIGPGARYYASWDQARSHFKQLRQRAAPNVTNWGNRWMKVLKWSKPIGKALKWGLRGLEGIGAAVTIYDGAKWAWNRLKKFSNNHRVPRPPMRSRRTRGSRGPKFKPRQIYTK